VTAGMLIFIGLIFGAVFLLAQALIVPAFGESARTRRIMRERLRRIQSTQEHEGFASLVREKYLKALSPTARWLESFPVMERLAGLIEQAGRSTQAHRVVLLAAILCVIGAILGWTFTRLPWVAMAAAAVSFALPFLKLVNERKARLAKIDEQLPDAVDVMKRALRAGHPFSSALRLVAEDMSNPIAKEFQTTFADLNYGNDVRRAMLGLLLRAPSVSMMAVITSVLVQKETGGNLAEIFDQISRVIRSRFRFGRKVRTLSAEGRMSAWILTLTPIVLFGIIWVTSPSYLPVLLNHPLGQKLMLFAGFLGVVGVLWMRKIIRIEV
jgi:tight adherence protein B